MSLHFKRQAIAILRLLNKRDATAEVANQATVDEASKAAAEQARARRPNLNFREMGIPMGSLLEADEKPDIKVTVIADRKVRFGDEEMSLSAATQKALALDYPVRPAPMWRYNSKLLSELYEETYSAVE